MHGELARTRCFSYICSVNRFERRPSGTHFSCVQRSIVKTFLPTRSYRREISGKNASPLMKIESFSIQNYKCIKDLAVDCRGADGEIRQWTVLLGENNTGKTNVLRALALLEPEEFNLQGLDKAFVPSILRRDRELIQLYYETFLKLGVKLENGEEWLFDSRKIQSFNFDPQIRLFGYGVSRYPARTVFDEFPFLSTDTLFSPYARLLDLQNWLLLLDYSAKHDSVIADRRLQWMRELVQSNLFPGLKDFCFEKAGENDNVVAKFVTEHDRNVSFEGLGFGYQTSLTWLADFCKRMFELYPKSKKPLQEEAVVLVDEIDLHLHPKWQRDLVPTLSKIFPNVQFIVTTHSPHVLQSMEDVNLYVLRRDAESGEITAERSDVTNFTGWTVEDILSVTMELGEDVLSIAYNAVKKEFEEAIRNKDRQKAQQCYERLDEMMRPGNPMRSIYRVRLEEMA